MSPPPSNCTLKFISPQVDCGVGGTCNETLAICTCTDSYVNYGDFIMLPGGACTIFTPIITALWILVFISCIIGLITSFWGINVRMQVRGAMTWSAIRASWRVWVIPVATSLLCVFLIPLAIGKFISPETWIVGIDENATILHCIAIWHAILALVSTALGILKAAMNESLVAMGGSSITKMFQKRYHTTKRVLYSLVVISLGSSLAPIALLSVFDPVHQRVIIGIHGMGMVLICFVAGVIVIPPFLQSMISHLTQSENLTGVSSDGAKMLRIIKMKMRVAWVFAFVGYGIQSIVISLFCLWPYLTRAGPYFLPLEYFCTIVACSVAIWITTTSKRRITHVRQSPDTTNNTRRSMARLSHAVRRVTNGAMMAVGITE